MLYLLFIFLFVFLLIHNYQVLKSVLSPPVLFTAVWLVSLIGLFISGNTLYPISWMTLMIYYAGACSFSFGGILGQLVRQGSPRVRSHRKNNDDSRQVIIHFALDFILLALLLGLPIYWWQIVEQYGWKSGMTLALLRALDVEQGGEVHSFNLIRNFPVIAVFLAYALSYENDGTISRRWRAYLAIALAIVYGSILGVKKTAVVVPITVILITSIRAGKVNKGMTVALLFYALTAFTIGLFQINFAYEQIGSFWEFFPILAATIQNYWLGGLVAFEQIVYDPQIMESAHGISRFFLETANSLGGNFYVPSLHANFTNISLYQNSNVYTIYFSYYKDWGLGATVLLIGCLGFICGYIYSWARSGKPIPVIFYSMIACAIILSIQAENFINGLNGYIKAAIFFVFIFKIVPHFGSVVVRTFKSPTPRVMSIKC